MQNIYQLWQAGELANEQALEELCQALDTLQDRLQPLQESEQVLRAQISEVVERLGGRAELAGFGSLNITGASVTSHYDRRGLDKLVERLRDEGQADLAAEIASYRQESARSGGLRISRSKQT